MHGFCFLIISDESKGENQNEKDDKWMNWMEKDDRKRGIETEKRIEYGNE